MKDGFPLGDVAPSSDCSSLSVTSQSKMSRSAATIGEEILEEPDALVVAGDVVERAGDVRVVVVACDQGLVGVNGYENVARFGAGDIVVRHVEDRGEGDRVEVEELETRLSYHVKERSRARAGDRATATFVGTSDALAVVNSLNRHNARHRHTTDTSVRDV